MSSPISILMKASVQLAIDREAKQGTALKLLFLGRAEEVSSGCVAASAPSPTATTLAIGPAMATTIDVEIVRKPKNQIGFAVHPRRWIVERFFAWISRNRRLWKDPEATITSAKASLHAAFVMILVRRLARSEWLSRRTLGKGRCRNMSGRENFSIRQGRKFVARPIQV